MNISFGHVDPGYEGSISIKLINLSSVDYTLVLGEPIYTVVFTKVETNKSGETLLTTR